MKKYEEDSYNWTHLFWDFLISCGIFCVASSSVLTFLEGVICGCGISCGSLFTNVTLSIEEYIIFKKFMQILKKKKKKEEKKK